MDKPVIPGLIDETEEALSLIAIGETELETWASSCAPKDKAAIEANGFKAKAGEVCRLLDDAGAVTMVLAGVGSAKLFDWGALPKALKSGTYRLDQLPEDTTAEQAAIGWALGAYKFDRFKKDAKPETAQLIWPAEADQSVAGRTIKATILVRDLINLPTSHMGPADLQEAAEMVAETFGAAITTIGPDQLIADNFPAIHAVGRAAADDRGPRLMDITWGDPAHPKVTIVGKGVCFDTGGLDIKPAAAMKLMKKDMGGAAHVLGLGWMIMAAKLPVRLRILIPAVENSVAGNAMRPGDVVPTRCGLTIEIGHTDAEGRVILADALALASEEVPDLLIDFATLTGAARVALGTECPALFSREQSLNDDLMAASRKTDDPLWPLPLFEAYRPQVKGKVADLTNAPEGGFGGAITAALFLDAFVTKGIDYAHIDVMAWNTTNKPGRPEGGEAMGMRAVYEALRARFEK